MLKIIFSNTFLRSIINFKLKKKIVIYNKNDGKSRSEEHKIIKHIRILFRLKEEQNNSVIKDIRSVLGLKKKLKKFKI